MIKRLQIWYHRRRAIYHKANAAQNRSFGEYPKMQKRLAYAEWHLEQVERLSK